MHSHSHFICYDQLVHDYWAANVWALYLFGSRVATFVFRKAPIPDNLRALMESFIPFPEPKPSFVAGCLLLGVWPGGVDMAWKVGHWSLTKPLANSGKFFIHAVVSTLYIVWFLFPSVIINTSKLYPDEPSM